MRRSSGRSPGRMTASTTRSFASSGRTGSCVGYPLTAGSSSKAMARREAVRFIGANRDITQRKEIEAAALESAGRRSSWRTLSSSLPAVRGGLPGRAPGPFQPGLRAVDRLRCGGAASHRLACGAHAAGVAGGEAAEAGGPAAAPGGRSPTRRSTSARTGPASRSSCWWVQRATPGSVQYYYAFITDITQRKQAEAATRRSLERLELLAWTAADLLQTDDPRGLVSSLCSRVMDAPEVRLVLQLSPGRGRPTACHLNACGGMSGHREAPRAAGFRQRHVCLRPRGEAVRPRQFAAFPRRPVPAGGGAAGDKGLRLPSAARHRGQGDRHPRVRKPDSRGLRRGGSAPDAGRLRPGGDGPGPHA